MVKIATIGAEEPNEKQHAGKLTQEFCSGVTPLGLTITFGGIPNSSSIDILVPYAIFDYIGAFLRNGFAHVDNVIPVIKTITWLLLSRLQGHKPHRNSPEPEPQHTPELSGTFRNPPPEPTPAHTGTLRNLPEPSKTSPAYAGLFNYISLD